MHVLHSFCILLLVFVAGSFCIRDTTFISDCKSCQNFVKFSKSAILEYDDFSVKNSLIEWCKSSGYGANYQVCTYLINDFFNTFENVEPSNFCPKIDACPSIQTTSTENGRSINKTKTNDTCDFCLQTVISIKEVASQDELKHVLTKSCDYFGKLKDECTKAMDANLDHLLDFVVHRMDPFKFCQIITLCSQSKLSNLEKVLNIYPVSIPENFKSDIKDPKKCVICRKIIKYVYDFLKNERTEEMIEIALGKVCAEFIFPQAQRKCRSMIAKDAERIVHLIVMYTEPELVCVILEYCIAKNEVHPPPPIPPPTCGFCKLILGLIFKEIKGKTTEEIKKQLNEVCDRYKSYKYHEACEQFITKYSEKLVDAILHNINEENACISAGFCFSSLAIKSKKPKCELCKIILEYVYKEIKDNNTEQGIIQALEQVCSVLSSRDVTECQSFVKQYTDILIKVIIAKTNPNSGCIYIGFCQSENHKAFLPPEIIQDIATYTSKSNCVLCKAVISWLYKTLNDKRIKGDIVSALDGVCDAILAQKERPRCEKWVLKYTQQIINIITTETNPDIVCSILGECTTLNDQEQIIPFTKIQDSAAFIPPKPSCALCKAILSFLYNFLNDKRSEEEIEHALDVVCDSLFTEKDRAKCECLVEKYTEQIINIITTEMDPDIACSILGECMELKNKQDQIIPFTKIEDTSVGVKLCGNSNVCDICKDIFAYVHQKVTDETTTEELEEDFDKACIALFPGKCPEQPVCLKFVADSINILIQLLSNQTDPSFACSMLNLCPKGKTEHEEIESVSLNYPEEKEKFIPEIKGAFCDICRQIFTQLHLMVTNPKSKDQIEAALDSICDVIFPSNSPEKSKCIQFVNSKTEAIIDASARDTHPDVICEDMKVCKFNDKKKLGGDELCYGCQLIAHYIQDRLYDSKTEEAINNYIESELCDNVKIAGWKDFCNSFIQQYAVQIEQAIAQKVFDPNFLCIQELKLCNNTQVKKNNPKLEFELIKPEKEQDCKLCTKLVNKLDKLLEEGFVNRDLTQLSIKICESVSENEKLKCKTLMDIFGVTFFRMIGHVKDAKSVCKSVDLCFISGQTHLLGGSKCTYGPTYWCHTSAHAAACKATSYCTSKVWMPTVN